MAKTQGKGWFRIRRQSKGEFTLFCYYAQDPATGARKERFHKLGLVLDYPDQPSRWKEVGRLGLTSFIENPLSDLTLAELVTRYIVSGAIAQKTLSQKRASGTISVLRHNLEDYCVPRWGTTRVLEIEAKALEEWLLHLKQRPLSGPQ